MNAWGLFVSKQKISISSFLKSLTPEIKGDSIVITVPNISKEEALESIRPEFAKFISTLTKGEILRLNIEVGASVVTESKPYTDKEKLEYLMKKYPKLADFVKKMEIRTK